MGSIPCRYKRTYCILAIISIVSVSTFIIQPQYIGKSHALYAFGEGNGTPLQYSCLENPMDRGAW